MRRQFDPARYRVVLFDQRNAGRSRPWAGEPAVDLATDTTPHLLAGIERLRVQAHLVAAGKDGAHVAHLAGLPSTVSGWEVDQLVPAVVLEVGAPALTAERAGDVGARLPVMVSRSGDHSVVLALATPAPLAEYAGGLIATAYEAEEWLDCDCHGPVAAEQLERGLAALPPPAVPFRWPRL